MTPAGTVSPSLGVDCHVHVFARGGGAFAPDRVYTPEPCQLGTGAYLRAILAGQGLTHALLVAAQPYGRDNSVMLAAMREAAGRYRGVALVDPAIRDHDLRKLVEAGVVGARVNLSTHGMRELVEPGASRFFARIKELGWFLQIHTEKDEIVEAMPCLRQLGLRLMIDHFGRPDPARGVGQPGFQAMLELGRSGNAVVKLSGPFRASLSGYPYTDIDPFIEAAIGAFSFDNCVWGSDWPFVRVDERIDYAPGFACLARWLPDPADRRKVLWDNPSRLFGFNAAAAAA